MDMRELRRRGSIYRFRRREEGRSLLQVFKRQIVVTQQRVSLPYRRQRFGNLPLGESLVLFVPSLTQGFLVILQRQLIAALHVVDISDVIERRRDTWCPP